MPRELREDDAAHALEHFMDVDLRRLRQAVRRQQPVHEELQAVGFLHDDLRVLVQRGPLELAVEQLRRAAYAAERVLDLVREIADQLAVRLALVEHALFARDPELLLDVPELDQETAAGNVRVDLDRRDGARQVQRARGRSRTA